MIFNQQPATSNQQPATSSSLIGVRLRGVRPQPSHTIKPLLALAIISLAACGGGSNGSAATTPLTTSQIKTAFLNSSEFDGGCVEPSQNINSAALVQCSDSALGNVEISSGSFDYASHNANPVGASGTAQQGYSVGEVESSVEAVSSALNSLSNNPSDLYVSNGGDVVLSIVADKGANGTLLNASAMGEVCLEGKDVANTTVSNGAIDLVSSANAGCYTANLNNLPVEGDYSEFSALNSDASTTDLTRVTLRATYNEVGAPSVSVNALLPGAECMFNGLVRKIEGCNIGLGIQATSPIGILETSLTHNGVGGQVTASGNTHTIAANQVAGTSLNYTATATDNSSSSATFQDTIGLDEDNLPVYGLAVQERPARATTFLGEAVLNFARDRMLNNSTDEEGDTFGVDNCEVVGNGLLEDFTSTNFGEGKRLDGGLTSADNGKTFPLTCQYTNGSGTLVGSPVTVINYTVDL